MAPNQPEQPDQGSEHLGMLIRISGLAAILGTILYAVSDVLLVGVSADLADHPGLRPHAALLGKMVKLVAVPKWRLAWGGLLGIFAAPLTVAGFWQMYRGLLRAGKVVALPPLLLFCWAQIVSPFLHGSHIYLGEYIQALDTLDPQSQAVVAAMIERHNRILAVTLGCMLSCVAIASLFYAALVLSGRTAFPRWLAAFNPLTVAIFWSLLSRLLPEPLRKATSGAGMNFAFLVFFGLNTLTLWRQRWGWQSAKKD